MASIGFRPAPVSRAAWVRIGDGLFDTAQSVGSTLRRLWQSWQASRRHVLEMRALRELSPSVLRDIGAPPESVYEARRWHDQHHLTRDAFLRGL
jgi:uncharacterized protein YjiS (DUF1127 family)